MLLNQLKHLLLVLGFVGKVFINPELLYSKVMEHEPGYLENRRRRQMIYVSINTFAYALQTPFFLSLLHYGGISWSSHFQHTTIDSLTHFLPFSSSNFACWQWGTCSPNAGSETATYLMRCGITNFCTTNSTAERLEWWKYC